jgi:hypothetical protein
MSNHDSDFDIVSGHGEDNDSGCEDFAQEAIGVGVAQALGTAVNQPNVTQDPIISRLSMKSVTLRIRF